MRFSIVAFGPIGTKGATTVKLRSGAGTSGECCMPVGERGCWSPALPRTELGAAVVAAVVAVCWLQWSLSSSLRALPWTSWSDYSALPDKGGDTSLAVP